MLIIKHTIETTASPEAVWNIWQDVKNWNTWDYKTEYSSLDGAFKRGTKGKWKLKGGPVSAIKLTRVEPLKIFVMEYKLFLARIVVSHQLCESAGKTQVTEQIEIRGPLGFFFAYHLGRAIKKSLPQDMQTLVKKAEK
jgi:Polyketide cyclase / dehydrase and lipid transport